MPSTKVWTLTHTLTQCLPPSAHSVNWDGLNPAAPPATVSNAQLDCA